MAVAVPQPEPDLNTHGPDLQKRTVHLGTNNISAGRGLVICVRGPSRNLRTWSTSCWPRSSRRQAGLRPFSA